MTNRSVGAMQPETTTRLTPEQAEQVRVLDGLGLFHEPRETGAQGIVELAQRIAPRSVAYTWLTDEDDALLRQTLEGQQAPVVVLRVHSFADLMLVLKQVRGFYWKIRAEDQQTIAT